MSTETTPSPLAGAFYVERTERGRLKLTGRDRQSFLQGMVTNDVAALKPGDGCYALQVDATAHVLADLRVLCRPDYLLLDVEPGMARTVAANLEKYLVMEKCRIADVTEETAQVFVGGLEAARVLAHLGISGAAEWPEGRNEEIGTSAGVPALVAATRLISGPGFDIYLPAEARGDMLADLRAAGAAERTAASLEALRIEAGVPRFGVDLDPRILAPEAGQAERAISYRKGCYIGQEVVARIDARGHTNRTLAGFLVDGDEAPASDAPVTVDGREVGRITSATVSTTLGRPIALGYIRNEFAAPDTAVGIGGGTGRVAALPFVAP